MALELFALVVLILACCAALLLSFFGLAGTFIVVLGAMAYDLITWSWVIPFDVLVLLGVIALVGEALEWLTPIVHGKVSLYAMFGIILGALLGASLLSFIPLIGSILGLLLGAIVGAFLAELMRTGDAQKAWRAAKVALHNRLIISATKTILTLTQIVILIIMLW